MSTVYLTPVNSSIYNNNEPQIVQLRTPNKVYRNYDSRWGNEAFNQNPIDMRISTRTTIGDNSSALVKGANRVSVVSFGFYNTIPNINPRNNQIILFSEASGTTHTVFIEEGYYPTSDDIISAIEDTLNSISVATGLTFSYQPFYPGPSKMYTLTAVGGGFRILDTCTAVTRGFITYNFESNPFNSASITVGPILGYYTRFIDVLSDNITQFSKNTAVSNNNSQNNQIFRAFTSAEPGTPKLISRVTNNDLVTTLNFNPDYTLYDIDIKLIDQFGDPLYIPDTYNYHNFFFDIGFVFE